MKLSVIMSFIKNPKYRNIFLVLLFLPLVFIDNRSSHDWGDDFAQYIHQAKNIVQGIPQSETGFIYSQENYIGPAAYPVGFPILLSPVYALFGNSMKAFTTYISLFYFALAFLLLVFYHRHFSFAAALALTMIIIYNPQLLLFKQEVMSDLPFTLFLVIAFLLYPKVQKKNDYQSLILYSLLIGFMIAIRSVGLVLIAAIVAEQLLVLNSRRKLARSEGKKIAVLEMLRFPVSLVVASAFFYLILNSILFHVPSGGSLRDYLVFYYSGDFLSTIPANLEHYVEVYRYIYTPAVGGFRFAALVVGSIFMAMTFFGFIKKISDKLEVFDLFFIFYVLILLVFPNNYSAFRLLIPVGFLLLYYAASGFKAIMLFSGISGSNKAIILGAFMFALFIPGIIRTAASRNTMLDGPQQKETVQAFNYVAKNLPDSAVIVFLKPRALALYTGRKGFADPFSADVTAIHLQVMQHHAGYILIHNELTGEPMKRYIRVMKSRASRVWGNKTFQLFKINPVNPAELY